MRKVLVLSLGLLLLLRGRAGQAPGLPGKVPYAPNDRECQAPEKEYYEESMDLCCSKCPPGSFREATCSRESDTECRECPIGAYTEAWNLIGSCLSCRGRCRADLGLVELQACTVRTKRRCACRNGTFCKAGLAESDTSCSDCAPHRSCPPGEGIRQRGTYSADAVCEFCKKGTFSKISSQSERCEPHTDCLKLGLNATKPGNATSDAECRPIVDQPEGRRGEKDTDAASVSLAVLCAVLLLVAAFTSASLLRAFDKEQPLQFPCFKKVFKTCIKDPESQVPEDSSADDLRDDQLLVTSGIYQRETGPVSQSPVALESETLRERPCLPSAGLSARAPPPIDSATGSAAETAADLSAGVVGPVYIYNPSRVYVGVISGQRDSRRSLPATEETAPEEGCLHYPQEEEGTLVRETGLPPEQEDGKESHLSESVSEGS